MNKVQILATITRDIELKYTQVGSAIANFGVAYNDKWKDQNGQIQEKAHFFEVTAFGKTGENINSFFRKGSRILIDGSLDYQSWVDQNQQKRNRVSIKLNGFDFIDRKSDTDSQNNQGGYTPQQGQQQSYQQPQPNYEDKNGNSQSQQQQQAHHSQHREMPSSDSLPVIDVDETGEIPF